MTLKHFIAAELIDWDYAPLGHDACTGRNFSEQQNTWVEKTKSTPGTAWVKAVYR